MPFDCCFSCPSFSLSLSLLAYLCDQRKWEDKIQDLKKKKSPHRIAKEATVTQMSSDGKPEHFPRDAVHLQLLS